MITIRPYITGDYAAVRKNLEEGDLFNPTKDTQEILEAKIRERPDSILVATINNQVIGSVYIIEDPWNSFIYRLAVQKEFRKRGIGSQLMEDAERRLREKGIKNIGLFVRDTHQELLDYYQKRGYTLMDISHRHMWKEL